MLDLYTITPKTFEELCCDYINNLYNKDDHYSVKHTRFTHDGGRDIEITFYDELHYFKIWAECKQHKRTIGLDDIGKNVVLVISKHIQKVIFFSVSEITESAQIEIIKIGDRLNFSVSFLCGKKLLDGLKTQPKLIEKYFGADAANELQNQLPLHEAEEIAIECSISEFENDNLLSVKDNKPICLQAGEMFNIYIHLRNETISPLRNITVELYSVSNAIIVTQTHWNHDALLSQEDIVAHFKGEIISKQKNRIELPQVALHYEIGSEVRNKILTLPPLDISKCKTYPFIGKSVTEFMSKEIGQVMEWSGRVQSQIIDLRGINGSGKTRLASEIQKKAASRGLRSIYLNSSDYIEYDLLRKMICELLHLPFYRGKIHFTKEDIQELIRLQGGSDTFCDVLASFMCQGVWRKEFSHYLVEAIAHFIVNPYRETGYCITIDNTQMFHPELLKLFIRLSELLSQTHSCTIMIFVSNTERAATAPKTFQAFLSYFDEKEHAHSPGFTSYTCSAFREEDVKLFLMQLFCFRKPQDPLLKELLKKVGRLPFEVTMSLEYLSDMNIIEWYNAKEWIIPDLDKFHAFMSAEFFEKRSILKNRAKAWKQTHTAVQTNKFIDILSTVTAFEGVLPYTYISDNRLDQNILEQMNHMLWLVPSHTQRGIAFFHDNIMDFCRSMPEYKNNAKVLRKVIRWLDNEADIDIPHREKIRFFCYYDLGRFTEAFRYGKELLCNIKQLPHEDILDISRTLYEDKRSQEEPESYIQISEIYADVLFSMDDKELGSIIYQDTVAYINRHPFVIDVERSCRLLHQAINSQLQSAKYDKAIQFLGILENTPELPARYRFIAENRYGVTYIALGQFEKAYKKLTSALTIASEQLEDLFWTSTAHSDIALYYFYHWKAFGRTAATAYIIDEFKIAIREYEESGSSNISRDIEMAWHKAFISVLQERYDKAIENACECIQLSEEYSQAYGLSRGYNLLALAHFFTGDIENAMSSLEEGLHSCALYSFPSGIFRMYNNLGVLHYRNGDYNKAVHYFKLAVSALDGQIEYKQYPVLTNLIVTARRLNDDELLRETGRRCNDIASTELFEYRKAISSKSNSKMKFDSFSFWNFEGAGYIF